MSKRQQQAPLSNTFYYYGYSSNTAAAAAATNCGAYENFDCINECLDEGDENGAAISSSMKKQQQQQQRREAKSSPSESDLDDIDGEEDEDDEEKCCFEVTSNLVEDGFIRMSSPVNERRNGKRSNGKIDEDNEAIIDEEAEGNLLHFSNPHNMTRKYSHSKVKSIFSNDSNNYDLSHYFGIFHSNLIKFT